MNKENYRDWIKKADADYDTVETLRESENPHLDIICFHCQQAIEKYLKAYLISLKSIRVPPKHDLDILLKLCLEQNSDFLSIDRVKSSSLTQYSVEIRYPDDYLDITLQEANEAKI